MLTRCCPSVFFGEFEVVEVREVNAEEYSQLASKGLIHEPKRVGPESRVWIIRFETFRKYSIPIKKKELTDVKTATSKKPIAKWVIKGLTYIDDVALKRIREKLMPIGE